MTIVGDIRGAQRFSEFLLYHGSLHEPVATARFRYIFTDSSRTHMAHISFARVPTHYTPLPLSSERFKQARAMYITLTLSAVLSNLSSTTIAKDLAEDYKNDKHTDMDLWCGVGSLYPQNNNHPLEKDLKCHQVSEDSLSRVHIYKGCKCEFLR